jgi:hypothetical protein
MEMFNFFGCIFNMKDSLNGISPYLLLFILFVAFRAHGQDVVKVVTLEGVTIQAVEDDFDTEAFIEKVRADSTFYLAFKAMNFYPSTYMAWLKVFKKGEKERGYVNRIAQRFREGDWMWVELLEEEVEGKIQKKNGEYKYLTAETWNDVFFPESKQRVSMNITRDFEKERGQSNVEKHQQEVKQMMFNPGNEVAGIPFIGKKMGIFEEDMHEYYTYSVYTAMYQDSIQCLVFAAEAKPEFRDGKTVIKSLTTYFEQSSFEVMQREVFLEYKSLPIDFEIFIRVENHHYKDILLPKMIYYKGFFDIPFMKKEEVEFSLFDFDYQL